MKPEHQPFISVQLPMFNEARVVDRLLKACTDIDYENYEILVADDSDDMTLDHLESCVCPILVVGDDLRPSDAGAFDLLRIRPLEVGEGSFVALEVLR